MTKLIGIDVGGTNLRLGVVQYLNNQAILIEEARFQADFSDYCKSHPADTAWQKILSTIDSAIKKVREKHSDILAVGIGFPGFIDPITQTISQSPNLPGLRNVDLSNDLQQLIKLPVITENDALAAAYGEYMSLGNKLQNMIYLGLGTGVGGGLIINGQPFQGQHGVAMEVGHIITQPQGRPCGCGNHGCMEQYASATGVANSYFESTGQQLEAVDVAKLATQGDAHAIAAYELAGISLAQALAHILKVIDVTDVLVGGGVSAAWPLMQTKFTQQLQQDLIPALRGRVNIHLASLDDQAGIIGAALLAFGHQEILK
ncbi:MAG TPA: ROK family protein [Methylotenera sp.]|nr:ROK family protein [Methylotenera sp.]